MPEDRNSLEDQLYRLVRVERHAKDSAYEAMLNQYKRREEDRKQLKLTPIQYWLEYDIQRDTGHLIRKLVEDQSDHVITFTLRGVGFWLTVHPSVGVCHCRLDAGGNEIDSARFSYGKFAEATTWLLLAIGDALEDCKQMEDE